MSNNFRGSSSGPGLSSHGNFVSKYSSGPGKKPMDITDYRSSYSKPLAQSAQKQTAKPDSASYKRETVLPGAFDSRDNYYSRNYKPSFGSELLSSTSQLYPRSSVAVGKADRLDPASYSRTDYSSIEDFDKNYSFHSTNGGKGMGSRSFVSNNFDSSNFMAKQT